MDLVIVKLGSEQEDNSRKFFSGKMGRQYHSSVVDHLVVSPSEKWKKLSLQIRFHCISLKAVFS